MLTPDDVHHKWFTTARLREGYDLGEVDNFLLDVEFAIDRLYRDCAALREQQLTSLPSEQPSASDGQNAARIIALADQTAGQALATACTEANRIIREAQERAAQIEQEGTARAQQAGRDAREQAADLDRKIRDKRSELEAMTSSRLTLERQLAGLRGLIDEYRSRMTVSLDDQLGEVERRADEYLGAATPSSAQLVQPTSPTWPAQTPHVPHQSSDPADIPASNGWTGR